MYKVRYMVSTVGTSLLTNFARRVGLPINLNEKANFSKAEYSPEEIAALEDMKEKILQELLPADMAKVQEMSAELNGIFSYYNKWAGDMKNDMFFFLHTDTYQGELAATILQEYLKRRTIPNVQRVKIDNLKTTNSREFLEGIKNLIHWCSETFEDTTGVEVIFNLTGGFKSFHAYMNTIGMFYADKIVYVFESKQAELLEIPKLPVTFEKQVLEENIPAFLLLDNKYTIEEKKFKVHFPQELPEVFVYKVDGLISLSSWGSLFFAQNHKRYLEKKLYELPYLKYLDQFKKDFEKAEPVHRVALQKNLHLFPQLFSMKVWLACNET